MNRRQFLESAACTSVLSALPTAAIEQASSVPATSRAQTVWTKPDLDVRGLELHSSRMWQWKAVMSAFSLMEKMNMNTLIFHKVDIQDAIVWPEKYFPADVPVVTPSKFFSQDVLSYRRTIQGLHDRMLFLPTARAYLRDVAAEAKKRKIKFFFEVCEIEYGDGLQQIHPEIMGAKGTICPTAPFWWDFLRDKYTELFEVLPDLDGVIVSPGTFESKLSIAMGICDCPSCSSTTSAEWYTKLIRSMYEPIERAGKTLVVRGFAYSKANEDMVMNSVKSVSPNIVAALKATPHDDYLTFPDNPRIGREGSNPQWIEFDAWGQFFGVGLFPCGVVNNMQRRLAYERKHGAVGAWFRTDLDGWLDESVSNSFNLLNLVAGALLSQDIDQNLENIYKAWLEIGIFDSLIPESMQPAPVPIPQKYLARFRSFMEASCSVAIKTYFVRGFPFSNSCTFPSSVNGSIYYMTVSSGLLDNFEPGANHRIEPTDENIAAIIAEKDEALAEVQKLPGILQVESLPLSDEFKAHIATVLSLYRELVLGLKLSANGIFRAKQAESTKQVKHARQGLKAADDLEEYRTKMTALLGAAYYPHYVHQIFDAPTINSLIKSIRGICTPLSRT